MDTRELRNVFGCFVTGVTVVTTVDAEGTDQGVTANSFSSVSLDPPLVLWSQAKSARSFPAFRDSEGFVVNILSEHQRSISQRFATPGTDKFAGISTIRIDGLPALQECCAYLQCRKVAMYPGGDHIVYLGEVVEVERNDRRPLAFARGKYMVAFEHDMNFELPEAEGAHLAHNDAVRLGCAALPELANRTGTAVGLAVWGNRGATIIRWEPAPRIGAPELRTGVVMSPLTSATGLLFGALLPDGMTAPILDEALARSGLGQSDLDRMRTEHEQRLTGVRSAGIASSPEVTSRGLYGISVPVFDGAGHMVLALCVVVARADDPERIRWIENECGQCARTLSQRLGYRESHPQAA
jgi:flavin reductase (DIM6/NTAB) family NADH-FMN oxidoreductase RutF/DNA-binding IclR family transcriptional regulator